MSIIFTQQEQTEKRFTMKQAYEQAAMVIRDRRRIDLHSNGQIFPNHSFSSSDDQKSLTLKELNDTVVRITDRHF